ncbi:hypothetical protein LAV76_01875 [Bacillus paramobilis]|uniref:hypothetical protein n=1 Tax=Bacillus paramobilis TaxID=2817477 RepID=UPI0030C95425
MNTWKEKLNNTLNDLKEQQLEEQLKHPMKMLYIMYKSLVEAGFSEKQAFELVETLFIGAIPSDVLKSKQILLVNKNSFSIHSDAFYFGLRGVVCNG